MSDTTSERQPKRPTKAQIRARVRQELLEESRKSDWILFWKDGYRLYTACGWCREQRLCGGKTRERMACKQCFLDKGRPKDIVFTQSIESFVRISGKL